MVNLLKRVGMFLVIVFLGTSLVNAEVPEEVRAGEDLPGQVREDELRETGLPQNLELEFDKIGGRAFLFAASWQTINRRDSWLASHYEKGGLARMAKDMGVTDLILVPGLRGRHRVTWRTELPVTTHRIPEGETEALAEIIRDADALGINTWISWHLDDQWASAEQAQKNVALYAHDAFGNYHLMKEGRLGGAFDFSSQYVRDFCFQAVDELKSRFGKYPHFKGIFFDEFWFSTFRDFHGDDLEGPFSRWSKEEFGEEPSESTLKRMEELTRVENALGTGGWHQVENLWWRRWELYRQRVFEEFTRDLSAYISSVGLQSINRPFNTGIVNARFAWRFGLSQKLTRYGDYLWTFGSDIHYANSISGIGWEITPGRIPHLHTTPIKGGGVSYFQHEMIMNQEFPEELIQAFLRYHHGWDRERAEAFAKRFGTSLTPRLRDEVAIMFRNGRRWYGGQDISKVGILFYQHGNILRFDNPGLVASQNEMRLLSTLRDFQPVGMLHVEDIPLFSFSTLVLPQITGRFLTSDVYRGLKSFVEEGGNLIVLGPVSESKADLTEEVFKNQEISGLTREEKINLKETNLVFSPTSPIFPGLKLNLGSSKVQKVKIEPDTGARVLAWDEKSARPLVVLQELGQGKVFTFLFDITEGLEPGSSLSSFFNLFLTSLEKPGVRQEGDLKIKAALKKDGDLGIVLLGERKEGIENLVRVDLKQIGLEGEKFTVTGRSLGIPVPYLNKSKGEFWSLEELREGIPVRINPFRGFEILEIEEVEND